MIKISDNGKMPPAFKREAEMELSQYVNVLKEKTGLVKPKEQKTPLQTVLF